MRIAFTTSLVLLGSLPMIAQYGGPGHAREFGGGFGFGRQHVVAGAPFSANMTNSKVQQLSTGNTIQQSSTGFIARDSQGRTYEKQTVSGGPLAPDTQKTLIFISDPVAGYSYVLNDETHTATRRPLHAWTGANTGSPHGANGHWQKSAQSDATDLGQDSSSGVVANGKSVTHVIPPGKIGNSAAITTSIQTWYSPDLHIIVKSVRNDPRFGQSTYTLSGVVKGEPDPSLFTIPTGYSVVDAQPHTPHTTSPGN